MLNGCELMLYCYVALKGSSNANVKEKWALSLIFKIFSKLSSVLKLFSIMVLILKLDEIISLAYKPYTIIIFCLESIPLFDVAEV